MSRANPINASEAGELARIETAGAASVEILDAGIGILELRLFEQRVAGGTGTEQEARTLLNEFVRRYDAHEAISLPLLWHFAEYLRYSLNGERMLAPAYEKAVLA